MAERDIEHVTHFPVKLWDVVDDDSNTIFTWSSDGLSFYVDDNKYEQEIMERYPGFVQISSFANLRRLLREYSFDWQSNDTGEFQFSHPSFKQGEREEIFNIRTKRKAIQAAVGQPFKPRRRNSRNGQSVTDKGKAWMQPIPPTGKVNLRVDTLLRFPEKFWAVVNDSNDMLYWGENGDTVIVDDKKYEEGIMAKYPGFVQINSFANLRRLLREYGFSWSICDNGFFEFSHSHMKKDQPELLKGVKTKRKAMRAGAHHPYLPFMRGDGTYHHHHLMKSYSGGDPFSNFEPEFRSSPEVDQAIGAIQHNDSRHFHHHHHSGSDQEQISPEGDTVDSNSEMRISSTGSSESVYASSKDSPTVFRADQLDMSSQEPSPPSYPLMTLQQSPTDEGYTVSCLNHPSKCSPSIEQPSCTECSLYQPPDSDAFPSTNSPLNLKTEAPSASNSPTELSLSCSHLNDDDCPGSSLVHQHSELNNNELKSDCDDGEFGALEMDNVAKVSPPLQPVSKNSRASNGLSYHHVKKIRGYKHSDSMKIPSVK